MPDAILREILSLCLTVEKAAAKIYAMLSKQAGLDEHKTFWQDVCSDEMRHVDYWERLLDLEEKKNLPNPFDRPTKVKAELEIMRAWIDEILAANKTFSDISDAILLAFRLESLMMHPAFFILYRSLRKEAGDESPEDEYKAHIDKFSRFVKKFLGAKPEMRLIGDLLHSMWGHGREVADQLDQIRILRGLIPICAKCKKVRNDQGYWDEIESYIEQHSHAQFSHSICPVCAHELYPEVV